MKYFLRMLLSVILCSFCNMNATTITAVAGTATTPVSWSLTTSWSPAQIPGAGDDVIIPNGKGIYFDAASATTIASLTVGTTGATKTAFVMTTGISLSITGDLVITGGTNSTTVTVQNSLSVANLTLNANSIFVTTNSTATNLTISGNLSLNASTSSFKAVSATSTLQHICTISGNITNTLGTMDMRNGSTGTTGAWDFIFVGPSSTYAGPAAPATHNGWFNAVTINKNSGAKLTLLSDMWQGSSSAAPATALTFISGIIETGNYTYCYQAGADGSVSGYNASNYVNGAFARPASSSAGSRSFPIGDENGFRFFQPYFGAVVTGSPNNLVTCRVVAANANTGSSTFPDGTIDGVSAIRYYKITYLKRSSTTDPLTLTKFAVSYDAQDGVAAGNTDLRVAYSTDARSTWYAAGLTTPPTTVLPGTIVTDDFTATPLTVTSGTGELYVALANKAGGINNPLPVELVSFGSSVNGSVLKLTWTTASEINSAKFFVERTSKSSGVWSKIGEVNAAGVSNAPRNYVYCDRFPVTGKVQYRLKMVDADGTSKYSSVIETEIGLPKNFSLIQNYPNPFNPSTTFNYAIPVDSKVALTVYNLLGNESGRLVNEFQKAGYHSMNFNAQGLPSGVYFYKLTATPVDGTKQYSMTKKMILAK